MIWCLILGAPPHPLAGVVGQHQVDYILDHKLSHAKILLETIILRSISANGKKKGGADLFRTTLSGIRIAEYPVMHQTRA